MSSGTIMGASRTLGSAVGTSSHWVVSIPIDPGPLAKPSRYFAIEAKESKYCRLPLLLLLAEMDDGDVEEANFRTSSWMRLSKSTLRNSRTSLAVILLVLDLGACPLSNEIGIEGTARTGPTGEVSAIPFTIDEVTFLGNFGSNEA